MPTFLTLDELEEGLDFIARSPADSGELKLIVRRPAIDAREELETGELNLDEGLAGDNWHAKPSSSMPNGEPHPQKQVTIMNVRAIEVIAAGDMERRKLAGDQLYVDMNLGYENLPPGTQLSIGNAVVEVTEPPHRGCKKFAARFGADAMRFVNSEAGRELNLRGINTRVVKAGEIRIGDIIRKLDK